MSLIQAFAQRKKTTTGGGVSSSSPLDPHQPVKKQLSNSNASSSSALPQSPAAAATIVRTVSDPTTNRTGTGTVAVAVHQPSLIHSSPVVVASLPSPSSSSSSVASSSTATPPRQSLSTNQPAHVQPSPIRSPSAAASHTHAHSAIHIRSHSSSSSSLSDISSGSGRYFSRLLAGTNTAATYTNTDSPRGTNGPQITSPHRVSTGHSSITSPDRFIPSRKSSDLSLLTQFESDENGMVTDHSAAAGTERHVGAFSLAYNLLLKNEMTPSQSSPDSPASSTSSASSVSSLSNHHRGRSSAGGPVSPMNPALVFHHSESSNHPSTPNRTTSDPAFSRFDFKSPDHSNPLFQSIGGVAASSPLASFGPHSLHSSTHRLLAQVSVTSRRHHLIGKVPFKVLDAPGLKDDFYLNLVDWSSQNLVAVGLGPLIYLWNGATGGVTKMGELEPINEMVSDAVTSVSWTLSGNHLAVGTKSGTIQIWDHIKQTCVRVMEGHTARVGSLAWNSTMLASGSRDRHILLHDPRTSGNSVVSTLEGHEQEVCGMKWSFDEHQLASGGNDNKLLLWSSRGPNRPIFRLSNHTAAVKAIAWSPHQHGLLASGGGTQDRRIRFWNSLTGSALSSLDTGSQICNLTWSKNCNELVSTHGYSLNQIICWKYPTMQQVTTLVGHTSRVLYLSLSPDGTTIVTGAGDETIRFWTLFPSAGGAHASPPGPHRISLGSLPSSSTIR